MTLTLMKRLFMLIALVLGTVALGSVLQGCGGGAATGDTLGDSEPEFETDDFPDDFAPEPLEPVQTPPRVFK